MFNRNFDPYELLLEMQERLSQLETMHNKLAHAFQESDHELTMALQLLRSLQQRHLKLRSDYDELKAQLGK
mgnify:CR=1 FL=1